MSVVVIFSTTFHGEEPVTLTARGETHELCRKCGESPDTMADLIRRITANDIT
ncbi:hypothetical protein ACFW6K_33040 [Streptomyces sp. NPDC058733]|uniref:hypothetical protein n=1 Tax=Streptomyces sp. NPDC058733 TaxID=3346614 RepID=UPI00367E846A